ncbi:eCIS core domain-containing protein [Aureibacter tunicatorum]|uniref:eCIS core domain-containing protein n=1 Tax=Aureibacter tunicatorum TaxID=866807 RepID=A0AAE4BTE4_9BACT|nr:DUF4157 domain-containing protein [Aureibacter tunicatorum]MDR6239487.1 hypothetical protein [Aureibacter tunicatorum]BDD04592.1 hypothetical protein AUTU_20750 [Aureibacter tunicatorum]
MNKNSKEQQHSNIAQRKADERMKANWMAVQRKKELDGDDTTPSLDYLNLTTAQLRADIDAIKSSENFQRWNTPSGQLPVQKKDDTGGSGNQGTTSKPNNTGLPDKLKTGVENLSGHSMDDVKVHYNSDKPAQLQAHAYAQGTDIHLASGQEKHLPHEAWHVVQQKQGRVKPTKQMKGKVNVNDDAGLEKEADVMGAKALQFIDNRPEGVAQRKLNKFKNNGDTEIQLKKYSVARNLNLSLATTDWSAKGEKGDEKYQSAKTRARGQMYADLREEYPITNTDGNHEEQENSRGVEYARKKLEIDTEFDKYSDDDITVQTSRPAIKPNAGKGKRRKNSQAGPINEMVSSIKYIGAHLVKREWGGADNMWNVVAWPQKAEDKWASIFETPVDSAGLRGEDPGNVKIEVRKEDEELKRPRASEIIQEEISKLEGADNEKANKRLLESPTAKRLLTSARWVSNRALESVPEVAKGTNFLGTVELSRSETKYEEAKKGAEEHFRKKAKEELKSEEELQIHSKSKDQLTDSWEEEEARMHELRKKERKRDWKVETDLYTPGFKIEDNIVDS